MGLRILSVVFGAAIFFAGTASGAELHEAENLILKEMAALDGAFKVTIEAIVLNQMESIAPAFEDVRKAREEVEAAVKKGAKISLPKNQKLFREFVRLDDRFHIELEKMLDAAKEKKSRVVKRQAHKLLDACVGCHETFKK